jgi:hypothetical protein
MRWRFLGSLLIVLATGWLLAGAAATTFASTGSLTYPASFAGASWIEAPGGAQAAYFRLSLNLPATPDLATLWVDANQQYQVYADGTYIAHSQSAVGPGSSRAADPVDLSWKLHKGMNGIGIKVVNGDGAPAALFGQLTLAFGDKQVTYNTAPTTWLAAPGPQQVSYPGIGTKDASFSSAAFDPSQWSYSTRATSLQPTARSLMPTEVVAGPLTGKVISAGASHDMRASSVIQVPGGARDAWLRIIAADAYTLSVDGHIVTDEPGAYFVASPGTQRRPQAAVNIYDIRPYLQAGRNSVLLHVYGSGSAAIYLDGIVDTGTGPVHIATGPGWQAAASTSQSAGQAAAGSAVILGPVSRIWPNGVRRTGVTPDLALKASTATTGQTNTLTVPLPSVPTAMSLDYTIIGMALILGLWLGAGIVTVRFARRALGRALLFDAAGHLPALAAAAAVATLARLSNWTPPWPYTPVVFWLLVAIFAAGKLSTIGGSVTVFRQLPQRLAWLPLRRLPQRPAWLPRAWPGIRVSGTVAHVTARRSAELGAQISAQLGAQIAAPIRLLFPPSPAVSPAAAQVGALAVGLDTGLTWRPAQRAWLRHLGRLPTGLRGFASRVISGLTWANGSVILVALATTGQLIYRLGYEPYSGDETVSLLAAQSIRAHLLPRFPSGLLYLKGELYEYPLAVFTAIFGNNPIPLRLITVLTYGATVLAFGLLLLPIVLRGRHRLAQVMLTLLFATAPIELQEAQLVRMYQQEQLFAIMFVAFFLLALRASRVAAGLEQQSPAPSGRLWSLATRWSIPLCAVTLVCMYLSLEESFILLPAIPVVLTGGLGLRWLRDQQWLRWGLPAVAVIGIQYCLTLVVKMPVLGYDNSNKPYVYYDPSNIYYYLAHYLLAIPGGTGGIAVGSGYGTLYLITSLAVLGGAVGIARRDFGRLYLSAFLWLPVLVLSTLFTAQAERYIVILVPMLFALAGLGALDILGWLRAMLTATSETRERRLIAGLILAATVPAFIWLAGSMPARVQDYGLTASSLAGVPYAQNQPDYTTVAAYMKSHEHPGDLFIVLGSGPQTSYYTGRPPDMVIQPHPNKFLYLTEKDGIVVEDYFGRPVILTAADLQQVIASHHRIWLMTDQGAYFDSVPTDMTDLIRAQFTEVAQSTQTALYFKGD